MCGRYLLTSPPDAVRAMFGFAEQPNFPPRYNIAPTEPIGVVVQDNGARSFRLMRWGFLPSWVKIPADFPLLTNARAETLLDKPSFKAAITYRRCLVAADGYYEWRGRAGARQPWLITRPEGGPMAFAALCETWSGPNGEEVDTVAIITVEASADLAMLHERMPALIAPDDFSPWLDCRAVDAKAACALLRSAPQGLLAMRPVSPKLNRAGYDAPDLIASYQPPAEASQPAAAPRPPRRMAASRERDDQGSLF